MGVTETFFHCNMKLKEGAPGRRARGRGAERERTV